MRILFVLLSVTCIPHVLLAQKEVEKKKTERYEDYKTRSSDISGDNVSTLLDEASALKATNPKRALNKVEEALGLSIAAGDVRNEARSYIVIGSINESIQEWKLALENYRKAYEKLSTRYTNDFDYRTALFGLADNYLRLADLASAMEWYKSLEKIKLTKEEQDRVRIGISEVYFQLGQYQEALNALEDGGSRKLKKDGGDNVAVQNQRAKVYARMLELSSARQAINSSQNALRAAPSAKPVQQQTQDDLSSAKEEVAGALHEQQLYDEEIQVRNEAIQFNLEKNNLPEVTRDKLGIGKALEAKGETSEAIRELTEAALMADTINDPKEQAKAFLALANLYEKHGRTKDALAAFKKYSKSIATAQEQNEQRLSDKADLIKKQKDIEELTKELSYGQQQETIQQGTVARQQLIIYGLMIIILIIAITSYFIYRNAQASKIANQMLALKSLRSQMNPHFIFNALNSVNQFIAQNDERSANKFLSEFSRLMRLVLENSQEDFIPLSTEQEIIALYLKLEHYRFRDKFEYTIIMDENIDPEAVVIPPMLIQPYIENAVWHGLRYKESKGHLTLTMNKEPGGISIEILDDGIGRKKSLALKTENQRKHQSTGLKNIEQRLLIINRVYKLNYRVAIFDGSTGGGTRVVVNIPEHKNGKI